MGNDKTLSGRKIRMLFCEKSFIPAGFCTVIADFSQSLSVTELCDRISSIPRSRLGWLYAIGSSSNITKLYGIRCGQVRTQTIICIIVICPSGYTDGGRGSGTCKQCLCLKLYRLAFFQAQHINSLFFALFQYIRYGKPGLRVNGFLLFAFLQRCIQFLFRKNFGAFYCFRFWFSLCDWFCGRFRLHGSFCCFTLFCR